MDNPNPSSELPELSSLPASPRNSPEQAPQSPQSPSPDIDSTLPPSSPPPRRQQAPLYTLPRPAQARQANPTSELEKLLAMLDMLQKIRWTADKFMGVMADHRKDYRVRKAYKQYKRFAYGTALRRDDDAVDKDD
ncbi:MAG: hypothetical protein MMC33_008286 [Icmadophila ericetorum]|nr:hypothetical protein [Icmadophila ericetorum]